METEEKTIDRSAARALGGKSIPCPTCRSTGSVREQRCVYCKGTGAVWNANLRNETRSNSVLGLVTPSDGLKR